MKKLLGLGLIALTLISCGENKSEDTFGKLKSDITVLNTKDDQYFSSSINYKCEDEENCNQNVVLVAIKNKKQLNTCTGALVSPSEVLVASTCFERPLEELNRACSEKIETISIDGTTTKCFRVTKHYEANNKKSVFIISLTKNLKHSEKLQNVDYSESYAALKTGNEYFQRQKRCNINYNLNVLPYSIGSNSEYLNSIDCLNHKGAILITENKLTGINVNNFSFINLKCSEITCTKESSLKDKLLSILKKSSNGIHKRLYKKYESQVIETNKLIGKPTLIIESGFIKLKSTPTCLKSKEDRIIEPIFMFKYDTNSNNEIIISSELEREQIRFIPIHLTNLFNINIDKPSVRTFDGRILKYNFYVSDNEKYRQFEFQIDGKYWVTPNDNNIKEFSLCN
jgi:hypothetical protein